MPGLALRRYDSFLKKLSSKFLDNNGVVTHDLSTSIKLPDPIKIRIYFFDGKRIFTRDFAMSMWKKAYNSNNAS